MPRTPKPVPVSQVCSECGLDWGLHGEKPTLDDCVRLLRAELATRPLWNNWPPYYVPYPQPYPQVPWTVPYPITYSPTTTWGTGGIQGTTNVNLLSSGI
jgi:hypothetical protein